MAVVTGAVIAAGTTVYAANQAKKGAQGAANATRDANNAAIGEQRRQFDITRGDMQPWLNAGTNALDMQQRYLNGDSSGFENSADYRFAVDQGFKGLDRGAAARGALYSGGADADRIALGQGLASQYGDKYYSKLAGLSNTGQGTATQLGSFGQTSATNIGNLLQNTGQARASSFQNRADTNSQLAFGLGGLLSSGLNQWQANRGG
ncbi:hypothetical protein ASD78_12305 [Lysobacter sp. Root667]|uniref:hypothetical protein n=1 Tax=Lysobacter sp. Root667 TaxID=1736581 RepID=UPI0006FE7F42|nr:hypothetical protein [Lysobacter sp. Root667]KRA74268.1 hypothetical protein ASD78_12305 [Lysobacter sp. Root667]